MTVTELTFDEYAERLKSENPEITHLYDRGDGTCWIVKRLLFHWTLIESLIGEFHSYETRYCYQTQLAACAAAELAVSLKAQEPDGWYRNPETGRRRPDGDASKEYVAW